MRQQIRRLKQGQQPPESGESRGGHCYCCNGACDIRGENRAVRHPFPLEIQSAAVIYFYNTGILDFFPGRDGWLRSAQEEKKLCHTWLLLVSVYFYYKAGGLFFVLLLFTSTVTYFTAMFTGRAAGNGMKRFWLTVNIIVLLGLLSYFKYAGFFTGCINSLLGTSFRTYDIFSAMSNSLFGTAFDVSQIVLPVGISFFTFQALSYSIDVYRGRIAPVNSFIDFSFYLTFFPQLVAGPIVRASEFIPQMKGDYTVTKNEFGHGVFLILQGLIKKMVISDFISAGFVDRVFDMPAMYSGFENLMAVYGYGLQIYCDFSGYTDIAIGAALLLGFRLPLNFNSPYKASNISDFWKRWHISLSRWLKDYLYIPLGGSRKGSGPHGYQPDDHHGAGRAVARGSAQICALGWSARRRADS